MTLRVQRLPQAFTVLAGESLFMYVAHLLVLFSAGIGIGRVYRHSLSLPVAIGIAILLIVATFVAAYAWAVYRGRGPKKVATGS